MIIPKIDIKEGNPQKLPSPGGRGLRQPSPIKGEGELDRVNLFFLDILMSFPI